MKLLRLFCITWLLSLLTACSDQVLNKIDTNPNQLDPAPLSALLPAASMTTIYQVAGSTAAIGSSNMAELTALTGTSPRIQPEIGLYTGNVWEGGYTALRTFREIRTQAEKEQKWGYVAIADIMSAYTLSILVDLFGDVPYSQAVMGAQNRQPAFDKAQDLYGEMQKLLDAGIVNCDKATTAALRPGKDDLVFGGNMALWKKTAYGLKARLFNRLSNVSPEESARQAIAATGNSFAASEAFTVSLYTTSPTNANPLSNAQLTQPVSAVGNGILHAMRFFLDNADDVAVDPRAGIWFTKISGKIVPAPNGRTSTDITVAGTLFSKPQHLRERAAPQPLLTPVELKFIEAEAQFRLGDKEKAYAAYEAAVRAALAQSAQFNPAVALTAAQQTAYPARPKVLPGAGGLTLAHILLQKYIYFFVFQPIEAYNDIRRTAILPLTDPNGTPKRLPYPDTERSRNALTPAVNDQTMFDTAVRLFWAKL